MLFIRLISKMTHSKEVPILLQKSAKAAWEYGRMHLHIFDSEKG